MVDHSEYFVKDVEGLSDRFSVAFPKKLKPELICCGCDALTPKGRKDRNGHMYCQACLAAGMTQPNQFTCSICRCKANTRDMQSCGKEWNILKKMNTACPNEQICHHQGVLEDVLQHSKTCGLQGKVRCSLCESLEDRKTIAAHMSSYCPRRVVDCCFCGADVEYCRKLDHELSCRERPGNCQYCKKEFKTFAELEDKHYPKCPQFPVNCAFEKLGCTFRGPRRDLGAHEATSKHTEMLVDKLCHLVEENEVLRNSLYEQEQKYGEQVTTLKGVTAEFQGQIERLQNQCTQMNEKLQAQEQELQAHAVKSAADKCAFQAYMTRTEEEVSFLKRELYFGPNQSLFEHVWKLHPYSELKRYALTSSKGSLSSGLLFINKPGYSIELVAAINRAGRGIISAPHHLAIKIRIHEGDYDDLLPWPFANKIRVVLVNQCDEAESRRFELDPSEADNAGACLTRPAPDRLNPMFGFSQLIPIPLLENERKGFLLRNCVILKISVLALD